MQYGKAEVGILYAETSTLCSVGHDDSGLVCGVALYGTLEGREVGVRRIGEEGHIAARVNDVYVESHHVVLGRYLAVGHRETHCVSLQAGFVGGQGGGYISAVLVFVIDNTLGV